MKKKTRRAIRSETNGYEPKKHPSSRQFTKQGLRTLRGRLVVLAALAVFPAFVVLLETALEQQHIAIRQSRNELKQLVQHVAFDHTDLLRQGRQLLTALASVPQVQHPTNPRVCQTLLRRLMLRDQRFVNFGVIAPNGDVVCSGVALHAPVNVAHRTYFRRAVVTHAFSIGDYQIGKITTLPVVVLALPTYKENGALASIAFGALSIRAFANGSTRSMLPPGASLTLLDASSTVLAHLPDSRIRIGMHEKALATMLATATSGRAHTLEMKMPGRSRRLYAIERLPGLATGSNVYVVADIPTHRAYAPGKVIYVRNLVVLGVLAVAVLLLSWLGGEILILRRTSTVVDVARRLSAGDFGARTGFPQNGDEIAVIGATVDRLAAVLERRKRNAEEDARRIRRLNRVYAVLSGINGAILRVRDRDTLLREVCRIGVEIGGFRLAWIGMVDDRSRVLRPVASHGDGMDYVASLNISLDPDLPQGQGPTGTAFRAGRYSVCNRIADSKSMRFWRDELLSRGLLSSAAFPLQSANRVIGILNLYAGEPDFFDKGELRLLDELAADTALGLEHIEQDHQIQYLAHYDPLTRLPNLSLFLDRLEQILARACRHDRAVGVAVLELVSYRESTTTVGRLAGDRMVKTIAAYLVGSVREGDVVARLGDAEFGIILADAARADDVILVMEQLAHALPELTNVADEEVFLKTRIGVAIHPDDGPDAESLLHKARVALRSARPENALRVSFYAPSLSASAHEQWHIEQALRRALDRKEMTLYYQPVVDLATREPIGLEALLRLTSPELSSLSTSVVISIAEETGLIQPIGSWVLQEACRQYRTWRAQGRHIGRLAVNVSAQQLGKADFLDEIRGWIGEIRDGHGDVALAIEITETELMTDIETTITVLSTVRAMGVSVYVDDFGTGFSSLEYLQRLPIDTLKIDQGFIRTLDKDPASIAIVSSVIALAQAIDLRTIAEGIETEKQAELLHRFGCQGAQGYLFARPMPVNELEDFLDTCKDT